MLPWEDSISCSLLISDSLSRSNSCRSAIPCSLIMHPLQLSECSMCMEEKEALPGLVTWGAWGAGNTSGTSCLVATCDKLTELLGKEWTGCTSPITWCDAVVTGVKLFDGGGPKSSKWVMVFSTRSSAAWIWASWVAWLSAQMAETIYISKPTCAENQHVIRGRPHTLPSHNTTYWLWTR